MPACLGHCNCAFVPTCAVSTDSIKLAVAEMNLARLAMDYKKSINTVETQALTIDRLTEELCSRH